MTRNSNKAAGSSSRRVTVADPPVAASKSSNKSKDSKAPTAPAPAKGTTDDDITISKAGNDSDSDDLLTHTRPTSKSIRTKDIPVFFKVLDDKSRACNLCNTKYGPKTGNDNLRRHLKKNHFDQYQQACEKNGWKYLAPPDNTPTVGEKRKSALPPFSAEAFLDYLVRFVTANDQPILVVECPEFRDLCMLLRESLRDKDIPRRHRLREGILDRFGREFERLKTDLSQSAGRISLTTDVWSNQQLTGFMAVTAHWIAVAEGKLTLRAGLIGFHHLKGRHTGRRMARVLRHIVDRAGIINKIGHITMDNADNNDTMMKELQILLRQDGITFNAKDRRIRCYPHIINICVSHIVSSVSKVSRADLRRDDPVEEGDDGSYVDKDEDDESDDGGYVGADEDDPEDEIDMDQLDPVVEKWFRTVKTNPVAKARAMVRTVRSSGQRREAFANAIKFGNENGSFLDDAKNPMIIKEKQLLRDVKHRWDSLYIMLQRLREMRQPIDLFCQVSKEVPLNESEWDVLNGLEIVLQAPHEVQQIMSAHATPVLSGAIPSFELFMTQWELLAVDHPNLQPWTDIGLKWAGKYYNRMDDTRAYIIAMWTVLNPCMRFSWIEREWGKKWVVMAKKIILAVMEEYHGRQAPKIHAATPASPVKRAPRFVGTASKYKLQDHPIYPQNDRPNTREEEFHKYKNAPLSPRDTDLVTFWQLQRQEFPTLFPISLDYLPIQASSVPCEFVFSSAGETDTKKRNRIKPQLMEALQILKFIYKKDRLNFAPPALNLEDVPRPLHDEELANMFTGDYADAMDRLLGNFAAEDSGDDEDGEGSDDDS